MNKIKERLEKADWKTITEKLDKKGYAIIPKVLPAEICRQLVLEYDNGPLYRKTVIMERYRFGLGEYKYFNYPLPAPVQTIRTEIYPHLVPIANEWMQRLKINITYPATHEDFISFCHGNGQKKPTVLILQYGEGGHNTLHQDLYGDIFFPIQAVLFLNDPETDFTGGEFVLTQQVPRAQSKVMVLKPEKGDLLVFTTSFKPAKGSKGYYRVNLKHGVSEVQTGRRYTLGIIFHDALS